MTDYGFEWGNITVERLAELPQGHRVLRVKTPRQDIEIYVTKTGLIRVFGTEYASGRHGEWMKPSTSSLTSQVPSLAP